MSFSLPVPAWLKPTQDSEAAENIRKGHNPWVDAVHLLWSVWIFFGPLMDKGFTSKWLVIVVASYPIFLLLYALCLVRPQRSLYRYTWAIALLGYITTAFDSSTGACYFIYGCVMFRACEYGWGKYLLNLFAMCAIFALVASQRGLPWQVIAYLIMMVAVISTVINVGISTSKKNAALKLSQDEVRRLAATAERERIGRDLHDLLGHTLSLITLKLELSRKLFDRDPVASRRELEEAENVARHALGEVRAAVTGIRATDLAAELASARLLLESSAVHLDYGNLPPSLPVDVERSLALVIREAVTNIHRHAGATEASVRFECTADKLDMQICDNGRGGQNAEGNGINGMRERVRALGGTLSIDSPPKRGTKISVHVPLGAKRRVAQDFASPADGEPSDLARGAA
ncbi:sensor histidine kinase [Dyella caseinilytica]|uniref:Sensor histidine kinase n=1 Tax=Dyella caseinilytica TaxID=1849581 RepID=A0ABX7GVS1_9GAMM|nr:sensor histidine kinase [Dyella caseinilytica]QRN54562.1 sensor histidine kinase [Dyella caseinilytica]GFZ95213.1 two-component sensor histidine kinase [Dyella caseinilytica]